VDGKDRPLATIDEGFTPIFSPIIFCFDAEEFYFDGIFVFATIANREGETDPSFHPTQSSSIK
jgi:hypothetical protein